MAELEETINPANLFKVLIATDIHLGYSEKDQIRGNDSFVTFEEILEIGKNHNVDFVLLGGDLFHENKPSRKTTHACMALLRKYCMGNNPCQVEFLSDQSVNFSNSRFPVVNYEDPNLNISMPVFSIHGNHDDPAGDGNLCALDILSVCGLVNYFGRPTSVDDITVSPILFQKGTAKLALYGLGSIRDERLHRTFLNQKVKMLRPKEDQDSWFNLLVLHQNRAKHGPTNYIPEKFLDPFLDLIFWGHEHECLIEPVHAEDPTLPFYITQPGSSVATSLSHGESRQKHVGILEIKTDKAFQITKIPLKTVRPFYMEDLVLSETDLDPTEEQKVMFFLTDKVEQLISKADQDHTGNKWQPNKPLIRLRVDYSGGFSSFNTQRFGQQFVDRVANPKDIILFYRKKEVKKKDSTIRPDVEERMLHLRPEALDNIRMEDLIKEYLTSSDNALELSILSENRMAQAVREFVDKDDNDAIQTLVNWQLDVAQRHLKQRNNVTGDEIETEAKRFVELRRNREEQKNEEEEEEARRVLAEQSRTSVNNNGFDDDGDLSDGDRGATASKQTSKRGRGRGKTTQGATSQRGRGSRGATRGRGEGRGSGRGTQGGRGRKNALITDAFSFGSGNSKEEATFISSSDDEEGFNAPLTSYKTSTQVKGPSTPSHSGRKKKTIQYEEESDDSDNPFSMEPRNKKMRR